MNFYDNKKQRMISQRSSLKWVIAVLGWVPFIFLNSITLGYASEGSSQKAASLQFEKSTFTLEDLRHPTLLSGKFSGGLSSDLVVLGLNRANQVSMSLYTLDKDGWNLKHQSKLKQTPTFVDVVNFDGVDRVISVQDRSISWVDPMSGTFHPILKTTQTYRTNTDHGVPAYDISRDLDGDGRDEWLLPTSDQIEIYTQSGDGKFSRSLDLGPIKPFKKEKESKSKTLLLQPKTLSWYLNRVQSVDYNQDGKMDLVFLKPNHLSVYFQNENGRFDSKPLEIKSAVSFHPDSLMARFSEQKGSPFWGHFLGWKSRTTWQSFLSMTDLNDDGIPDFTTRTTEGRSFVNLRSSVGVHWGKANGESLRFETDPDESIHPKESHPLGYASHQLIDLDHDDKMEIVVTTVDAGLGDMFEALVASSIDQFVEVYHMQQGSYGEKPDVKFKIHPDSHLFKKKGPFFPGLLFGDCNGDGYVDLVAGHDWDELHVYAGIPAPDFFSDDPIEIHVNLPANEHQMRLFDFNHDGKQDVFMHRKVNDDDVEVTVLMAQ